MNKIETLWQGAQDAGIVSLSLCIAAEPTLFLIFWTWDRDSASTHVVTYTEVQPIQQGMAIIKLISSFTASSHVILGTRQMVYLASATYIIFLNLFCLFPFQICYFLK